MHHHVNASEKYIKSVVRVRDAVVVIAESTADFFVG